MLRPGDAAPDFLLKDADGRDLRLSNFSGRLIVLFFYPKDGTPGCTIEAKRFRDEHEALTSLGAVVVGVSLDSAASHCDFRDKHGLPFHLVSDPDGRAHDLYQAWRTTLLGKRSVAVRRCTYLIDDDGVIVRVHRSVNPWRHAAAVRQDLERLAAQKSSWGIGKKRQTVMSRVLRR